MKHFVLLLACTFCFWLMAAAQSADSAAAAPADTTKLVKLKSMKTYFGIASYYADKFNGRKTTSGELYNHTKPTAASNVVPLGTWIRVTNLNNKRSVVVRVNDRMHPRMKRVVDLSRSSAEKLGYTSRGLTQVKVEVLGRQTPDSELVQAAKN